MDENKMFFDEEFKEKAKKTVDTAEKAVKKNKGLIATLGILFSGMLIGSIFTKRANRKENKILINAAKEAARHEFADELLREAMRASVQNTIK